jgi:hypothetical protein
MKLLLDAHALLWFLARPRDARGLVKAEFATQVEGNDEIQPDGRSVPEPATHRDDRQRIVLRQIADAPFRPRPNFRPGRRKDEATPVSAPNFRPQFSPLMGLRPRPA